MGMARNQEGMERNQEKMESRRDLLAMMAKNQSAVMVKKLQSQLRKVISQNVLMDLHQRSQMVNQEMMARNQEGMERNQEKMERNQEAMERNQETMERNQEEINLRKTMAESLLVVMANNPHAVMDYHGNGSRMIRAAAQTKLNLSAKM